MTGLSIHNPADPLEPQLRSFLSTLVEVLETLPGRSENFWLEIFPVRSCSAASYVAGKLLAECGFGDWNFVEGLNERTNGHSWLEWRQNGELPMPLFSMDPTAHQFAEFDEPFVVADISPLSARFSSNRKDFLVSSLPDWMVRDLYVEALHDVRASLPGNHALRDPNATS